MEVKRMLVIGMAACVSACTAPVYAIQVQTGQEQGDNVYPAELSVPFGVVQGTLVTSSDHLIFIDNQQPGGSFAIPKSDLGEFRFEGDRMAVELKNPVKDRSGERKNLTFRMADARRNESLGAWMRSAPEYVARGGAERNAPASDQSTVYQVIHKHLIGECTGRLIIGDDRLNFESVTNLNDSRQWSLQDIREVKHQNPYELEVQPFTGNTYNFELLGQGMDSAAYKRLVDRITTLRTR